MNGEPATHAAVVCVQTMSGLMADQHIVEKRTKQLVLAFVTERPDRTLAWFEVPNQHSFARLLYEEGNPVPVGVEVTYARKREVRF